MRRAIHGGLHPASHVHGLAATPALTTCTYCAGLLIVLAHGRRLLIVPVHAEDAPGLFLTFPPKSRGKSAHEWHLASHAPVLATAMRSFPATATGQAVSPRTHGSTDTCTRAHAHTAHACTEQTTHTHTHIHAYICIPTVSKCRWHSRAPPSVAKAHHHTSRDA